MCRSANVAPFGICDATLVPVVRLQVAPLVLVPVTVELRLPLKALKAAAAKLTMLVPALPGRLITP